MFSLCSAASRSYRSGQLVGNGGSEGGGLAPLRSPHTSRTAAASVEGLEELVLGEDHQVDEVPYSGVLAVAEIPSIPWNFSAACRLTSMISTSGESIPAKSSEFGNGRRSVAPSSSDARRNVHLDATEGPARKLCSDLHPPCEAAAVILHQLLDRSGDERKLVTIDVHFQGFDESFPQLLGICHIATEPEVDVFGEPSVVPQPDLQRHRHP